MFWHVRGCACCYAGFLNRRRHFNFARFGVGVFFHFRTLHPHFRQLSLRIRFYGSLLSHGLLQVFVAEGADVALLYACTIAHFKVNDEIPQSSGGGGP